LRDQEATPPRKEAPVTLDEDEKNDDAPKGRKKQREAGWKKRIEDRIEEEGQARKVEGEDR
jgi:hypothetical protein